MFTLNNGKRINVQICNTDGGERFNYIIKLIVKWVKGLVYVYDISSRSSLDVSKRYLNNI